MLISYIEKLNNMIRSYLPSFISIPLFGDRERYGKTPWEDDKDWQHWLSLYPQVYFETQRKGGIQRLINNKGYDLLKTLDLQDKIVAEIGPGGGYHFEFFKGSPKHYTAIDVCENFLSVLQSKAVERAIPHQFYLLDHGTSSLPLETGSQDIIISFYSFEHLNPLDSWIKEIHRILRPGGIFAGAVPVEGGLAWGLGRYLTSRCILRKKFGLDIKKIVCWEHPNMIDEMVSGLISNFQTVTVSKFPFPFLPFDFNLVAKFIAYKK